MSRSRILTYGLALILGATVGRSTVVHADTVNLSCHGASLPDFYVSIDQSAGTAAAWVTGYKRSDIPASPATITTDQVTWAIRSGGKTIQYTLARTTGVLTQLEPGETNYWKCTRDKPVF